MMGANTNLFYETINQALNNGAVELYLDSTAIDMHVVITWDNIDYFDEERLCVTIEDSELTIFLMGAKIEEDDDEYGDWLVVNLSDGICLHVSK